MKTMTSLGEFTILHFPKRTLAYIRHTGPYMGDTALFERLFKQVMAWVAPKGLLQGPDNEAMTIYHDHPDYVPVEKQRISVGFTVPEGTEGEGDIQIMELPAGRYAVGTFEILPDQYGLAWGQMMEYVQTEKLMLTEAGPVYESYKNDPREHPEGKHVVDICLALQN